jgi:predicted nucleic acid-binding protein
MIVLDTNVVSEPTKAKPDLVVRAWLDAQAIETLFLTSVSVAELLFGIEAMPQGKRRRQLGQATDDTLQDFAGRILPFDEQAARHYANMALTARKAGLGFPVPDGYIAAIAASRKFAIATRDTTPFAAVGLKVINPWEYQR